MSKRVCLVATTIGSGEFLEDYRKNAEAEGVENDITFIIIPDLKTPASLFESCEMLRKNGIKVICPSVDEQDSYLSGLGRVRKTIPYNSDNRRNIGYLMAWEQNCDVLISIDDDNFPSESFFHQHLITGDTLKAEVIESCSGWYNICDLLEIEPKTTYPRGFPYEHRHKQPALNTLSEEGQVGINAGLWTGHPDIDAVSCLYAPAEAKRLVGGPYLLGKSTWSPINTQNTALMWDAIPAYYFLRMGYPVMGMPIDRDGDIFSGYFVQACARHLGYRIRIGLPITRHVRNTHNYMKDLSFELACIWILEDITAWLCSVKLEGNSFYETYLCLSEKLEDAAETFSGFIWTDATRGYFHYMAYCMRAWLEAIRVLHGS